MWLNEIFRRWRGRPAAGRPTRPQPIRPGRRLTLEQLEDRTVPANFTAASVPELIADVNAANLLGGPNTITLVAGTRFTLTAADNAADDGNGLPVIAAGDDLTVVGNGDVLERSTATGTPAFRLLDVAAGASLTMTNLTLQGGRTWAGGGAVSNHGNLTLDGVIVQNNVAAGYQAAGGGIWSNGSLTLQGNTRVQNNQALGSDGFFDPLFLIYALAGSASGGGVYVAGGTALLNGVTLSGNTARGGNGAEGIFFTFDTTYLYPTPGGSGAGGGLFVAGGTVELHGTSVTGNTAAGGAGGRVGHQTASRGAGVGGGVFIDPAALVCLDAFTQSHVKGNKASTADRDIHGPWTPC